MYDPQALTKKVQELEREKERLSSELRKHKRQPSRIITYLLLFLGATSLILSIVFTSVVLSLIGLGLSFWGAILRFITRTKYVKSTLLDSTVISSLNNIGRILDSLEYKGKGIYLPPEYLEDLKGGRMFIPAKEKVVVPQIKEEKELAFRPDPRGIYLIPSGVGLANLFEREMGTDFSRVDLSYLQNNLPNLFVEDLEIAEDLELDLEGNVVHVKIVGSVYKNLCNEVRKLSKVCSSFGCPLCSSIACALARITGKPIVIERRHFSNDGKVIEVYYRIING